MGIIFYHQTFDTPFWVRELEKQLPGARAREWKAGDNQSADYALVWYPLVEMLQGWALKAVFVLRAGVDSILSKLRDHPDMLPLSIPLFCLEDTGMGRQMQEYVVSQVLHWSRRFDNYQALKLAPRWQPLPEYRADEPTVGITGAGVLGAKVAESLQPRGLPLRVWNRSRKPWPQVQSSAGQVELGEFLQGTRVLINLLPNTIETAGITNQMLLAQLPDESYILNLACGVHVVEEDLLAALNSGKLKGAVLDIFSREPLLQESPLWAYLRVAMTPHAAVVTRPMEAITHIAEIIGRLERRESVSSRVDRQRGYQDERTPPWRGFC